MFDRGWKQQHLPCPCGKSSDAYSINIQGFGKCFSCDKWFSEKEKEELMEEEKITPPQGKELIKYYAHRGISEQTFRYYGVETKFYDNQPYEVGFVYPNGSYQIRNFNDKKFYVKGDIKDSGLFGADKFDPSAFSVVTITEGAYDAMSVYDIMGKETAAVSVRNAQYAFNECKQDKNWNYLNSFKKIVLCLDNDEHGNAAARQIASLFDFNKVYRVQFNRHKDANDYLQVGEFEELRHAWLNAKRYTPDNVISTFSEVSQALTESDDECLATYPFATLQNALYGLYAGEVVVFKGDEGIGKTALFKAMEYHILKENKENKIAVVHLEESESKTIKSLAGYEDKYPYAHPLVKVDKETILNAYRKLVDNREDRLYIYESYDVEDEKSFMDNIRFLLSACGCRILFWDHITWLATGLDKEEDERRRLDRLSQRTKLLAKELNVCVCVISHTNDDGKTRGSRNITKNADVVVHMKRDIVSLSEQEKNRLYFIIEKGREGRETGPAGYAVFDKETMRLIDPQVEMELKL